jgi:hypothetical protein
MLAALLVGLCEAKPRRFLPFAPREIGVEKSQRVWWAYYPNSLSPLRFGNLLMQLFHPSPMQLGPEMVFGMVAIVKKSQLYSLW